MYYKEKRTIATLISGILLFAIYCIYALKWVRVGNLGNDLQFWAGKMLIFIGMGIIATIVIQIVFHVINAIVNEVKHQEQDDTDIEDEMDKLISLKAMRNAYIIVCIGFGFSLISLVFLKHPPLVMINIIYISFNVGSIFEGFSQLYFYRRGVRNG